MSEQDQPTLEYLGATVNPGVPDSTRMVEISGLPSGRVPVTAATPTTAVMDVPELVMNDFDPSITHSPPSSRARVRIAPATSVPPPGSVSPNAASCSPAHSPGSQCRFCSCVPNR